MTCRSRWSVLDLEAVLRHLVRAIRIVEEPRLRLLLLRHPALHGLAEPYVFCVFHAGIISNLPDHPSRHHMGIVLLQKLGVAMILMIFAELLLRPNGTTEVIFDLSPYPIPDLL